MRYLTMSNVDGSGRQLLLIVRASGDYIRAGCFYGTCQEFIDRALSEGKHVYATVIPAVFKALRDASESRS